MYLHTVRTDGNTNPISDGQQDIYIPNCTADYDAILCKLNSPLFARSADRAYWFLSLNPLDWQTDKYDPSKGLT